MSESREAVGAAVAAVIEAHEAERQRICLDLHDGVVQTLTHVWLRLQAIEAVPDATLSEARPMIAQAASLIREAEREVRELIYRLRPASLDAVGLVKTLEAEVEALTREYEGKLRIDFETNVAVLPDQMEVAIYRVAHEALNNVVRHARARRVALRLEAAEGVVRLVIQDDGVGFDPAKTPGPDNRRFPRGGGGLGLIGMAARADALQGTLTVTSKPGRGTTAEMVAPLPGKGHETS